jgi:hypothetical protein
MRRTISRTFPRTALALAAAALPLTGCGGGGSGSGSGSVSPSPTATKPPATSPAPSKGSPTESPTGCTAAATLSARDSGRKVCLAVGDTLRITLDGTAKRPWKPVAVQGSGLEAVNSGLVLQPGDASAAFRAVAHGTARLQSTRPLCAAQTGRVSCLGLQEWWVTVVVR